MSFDGIDDFIDFPNNTTLKPQFPISFSFWVKYDSNISGTRSLFNTSFEDDRSSGVFFNVSNNGNRYAINYGNGDSSYISSSRRSYVSNSSLTDSGIWRHIAVVITSFNVMKIYVDCNEVGGTYSGTGTNLFYSSSPGTLGRHDRNLNTLEEYFDGQLDDFRYWDRALNIAEINLLCEATLSETDMDLVQRSLKTYPNPSNGEVTIFDSVNTIKSVNVYNSKGILIDENDYQEKLDLTHLSTGLYFLEVNYMDGSKVVEKLLLKR